MREDALAVAKFNQQKSETACEQYARASEYSENLIVSGLARDRLSMTDFHVCKPRADNGRNGL